MTEPRPVRERMREVHERTAELRRQREERARQLVVSEAMPQPRLESQAVKGDIVFDMHTRQPVFCNACRADLTARGHRSGCAHRVASA